VSSLFRASARERCPACVWVMCCAVTMPRVDWLVLCHRGSLAVPQHYSCSLVLGRGL
jgi:hypothetical protein